MEDDFYKIETICENCREFQTVKIPKERSVEPFLSDTRCKNCGCKRLKF